MMTRLEKLQEYNVRCASWYAIITACGMLALVFMTTTNILMRELFSSPLNGVYEVGGLIVGVVVAASFPVAFATEQQVQVKLLSTLAGKKTTAFFDLFAALVTLTGLAFLSFYFFGYFWENFHIAEKTVVAGFLLWPFLALIELSFVFALLSQLLVVSRYWMVFVRLCTSDFLKEH